MIPRPCRTSGRLRHTLLAKRHNEMETVVCSQAAGREADVTGCLVRSTPMKMFQVRTQYQVSAILKSPLWCRGCKVDYGLHGDADALQQHLAENYIIGQTFAR